MISVGIIGGTGYTGQKLIQLCSFHPYINNIEVYSAATAGRKIHDFFPETEGILPNIEFKSANNLSYEHDLYFTALPHGIAMEYIPLLLEKDLTIIDLGGDYRLDDVKDFEHWYNLKHTSPKLLNEKFYGLADLYLADDRKSLIANPGCYPTAALLGLIPAVKKIGDNIISITVNAYSGTSGAGKSAKPELQFYEMFENVRAYGVQSHRHTPEIMQEISKIYKVKNFTFTPHLIPVKSGIYSTSVIHTTQPVSNNDLAESFRNQFSNSPFVRVRNTPPELKWVLGTNFCDLFISVNNNTVIVISAIDNLIKGAAGQAIQNMNNIFGWDQAAGILNSKNGAVQYA